MRFTVEGDSQHCTVGENAAFMLLLVHVVPFTILQGSMLAVLFLLCTCSDSYCPLQSLLQFAEILRFTPVNGASGRPVRLMRYLGADTLSSRLWPYTSFLQLVLVLYYPF